jgi:hypothetical protein
VESYTGQHSVFVFESWKFFELARVKSGSINVGQYSDCFWVMLIPCELAGVQNRWIKIGLAVVCVEYSGLFF